MTFINGFQAGVAVARAMPGHMHKYVMQIYTKPLTCPHASVPVRPYPEVRPVSVERRLAISGI